MKLRPIAIALLASTAPVFAGGNVLVDSSESIRFLDAPAARRR
jgi:hypothetical protein